MLDSLTTAIRREITIARTVVAKQTAHAVRIGAIIGAALGTVLGVILLALGFIIGRL